MKKMKIVVRGLFLSLVIACAMPITAMAAPSTAPYIDTACADKGYVQVHRLAGDAVQKCIVSANGQTTSYVLDTECVNVPLIHGSGDYSISLGVQQSGTKYNIKEKASVNVTVSDAAYLSSTCAVSYENTKAVEIAAALCKGKKTASEKIQTVHTYVIDLMDYDYNKAATVKPGYMPKLDDILAAKKGICMDYAALMAGMLRSQNVPCKMVAGYVDGQYHAWIEAFNGASWVRFDPTFTDSSNNSAAVQAMIADPGAYVTRYEY